MNSKIGKYIIPFSLVIIFFNIIMISVLFLNEYGIIKFQNTQDNSNLNEEMSEIVSQPIVSVPISSAKI